MCKYWHETDDGRGLMEVCKLTNRIVNCCGDLVWCKFHSLYIEKEVQKIDSVTHSARITGMWELLILLQSENLLELEDIKRVRDIIKAKDNKNDTKTD